MKIKIEKVYVNDTKKNGEPYVTKKGDKFAITKVYDGEKYYTAFDYDGWTREWKPGDEIDVMVETKEWQGKTQYMIKQPSRLDEVEKFLTELDERLRKVESKLKGESGSAEDTEMVPDDIDPEDLPF